MSTREEELLACLRAWMEAYCPGVLLSDPEALRRLVAIVDEQVESSWRAQCWKAQRVLTAPCNR
jgi:hypothetical protein